MPAIHQLSEKKIEQLLPHQNLAYAIVGGLAISITCAVLWAIITVVTEYQIGIMAIGVGILVGLGVRYFGAGVELIYGVIGAFFALLGCILGNLFTQVGFIGNEQTISYFEVLTYLDLNTIVLLYKESFNIIDILFYGIAMQQGYVLAFRLLPENIDDAQSEGIMISDKYAPAYSEYRLPLIAVTFILLSLFAYKFSQGVNGLQSYYYDSGQLMSIGELQGSKETGTWEYFFENGETQLIANYAEGIENGGWVWYNESGQIVKQGLYKNGLIEGNWLHYYEDSTLSASQNYSNNRLMGETIVYHENGQISEKINYNRDLQDGQYTAFFENGQKQSEGIYEAGVPKGIWTTWKENGELNEELEFLADNITKTINSWNKEGQQMIKKGFGDYKMYHENGKTASSGRIENGLKTGVWHFYRSTGVETEAGSYDENQVYKMINSWSLDGQPQVVNGEGDYISYFSGSVLLFEKGFIKDGLREGAWVTYGYDPNKVQVESNYLAGQLNGEHTTFFQNGILYSEGNYTDGQQTGEWNWYYDSGQLSSTAHFVNGQKEGEQLFWNEIGRATKEEQYESGELISENAMNQVN